MTLDDITRDWLSRPEEEKPIPEGQERKFGLTGKFIQYSDLDDLEQNHLEYNGREWKPFSYVFPDWPEIRAKLEAKMLPGDEIWKVNDAIIWIIRDGGIIKKTFVYPQSVVEVVDEDFRLDLFTAL